MSFETQVINMLRQDGARMDALKCASMLGLNDWCLAAGFIRNLVWDNLHGYGQSTPLNDIDLIYYDVENCDAIFDREYEEKLKTMSYLPWSVKNQARMHIRNKDKPYMSTRDALSYWPELETAVGARLSPDGDIELVAPFGCSALFSNSITFNKKSLKLKDFKDRVESKQWLQKWPKLDVVMD